MQLCARINIELKSELSNIDSPANYFFTVRYLKDCFHIYTYLYKEKSVISSLFSFDHKNYVDSVSTCVAISSTIYLAHRLTATSTF